MNPDSPSEAITPLAYETPGHLTLVADLTPGAASVKCVSQIGKPRWQAWAAVATAVILAAAGTGIYWQSSSHRAQAGALVVLAALVGGFAVLLFLVNTREFSLLVISAETVVVHWPTGTVMFNAEEITALLAVPVDVPPAHSQLYLEFSDGRRFQIGVGTADEVTLIHDTFCAGRGRLLARTHADALPVADHARDGERGQK